MSLRQLAKTWNSFGKEDPLWAILSHREKRGNQWRLEEFLRTGEEEIAQVLEEARLLYPQLNTQRALDFGCGVGRLSQALAAEFAQVDGVDIAPSMLAQAREINRHGDRCQYHLNQNPDLRLFADGSFSFIYSNITLQHMPPELAQGYIREFCRLLQSDGLLVFQLPSQRKQPLHGVRKVAYSVLRFGYLFYHRRLRQRPIMDMFGTEPAQVALILKQEGCQVLEQQENSNAGPEWQSYRYFVKRS